jgi:hypothetical protein
MAVMGNARKLQSRNTYGTDHLIEQEADGVIKPSQTSRYSMWTELNWLMIATSG